MSKTAKAAVAAKAMDGDSETCSVPFSDRFFAFCMCRCLPSSREARGVAAMGMRAARGPGGGSSRPATCSCAD
ncbi:MAG: hypothetical protein ACPIOQ_20895 [Promethearchaeia archaeon]